ncbi:(2Fe-2S)-binding protein [Novosphingobium sp. Leaf2]|uniref:(2Fe-2S)-binding protein n=1 Tax=Novosphingobium sp. Leaf2 TaxID=1735670 RepID=UPI0006FA9F2A|nr:(2Fe-2S)-binding protein [Novosphingobium sp. Leaf2]KQM18344.1 hypothetical protein ASE49_09010 [Novosphingobium sp. Leaf2]
MKRIEAGVTRPAPIAITIDGAAVQVHPGETLAVAVLAVSRRFRDDRAGQARGMFCNMGTCSECTVWVARDDGAWRRLRACLIPVEPGMQVRTRPPQPAPEAMT